MEKLSTAERAAYVLGLAICFISDAVRDAWHWLECPAPDQPRPVENPSPLSNQVVMAISIAAIALTLVSLIVLWNLSPAK